MIEKNQNKPSFTCLSVIAFFLLFFTIQFKSVLAENVYDFFRNDMFEGQLEKFEKQNNYFVSKEPVSVYEKYNLDSKGEAQIEFTKLEEPDVIKLRRINPNNNLRQVGSIVYEIDSPMPDQSFKYNLKLPIKDRNGDGLIDNVEANDLTDVEVFYKETDDFNGDYTKASFENVLNSEGVEIEINKDEKWVLISNLDHFTIFVVSGSSDWQTWQNGNCLDPVNMDGDPNGNCFSSFYEALDASSPGDIINYGLNDSLLVMDYGYELSEENLNAGSINKDEQCFFHTNKRKEKEGVYQEVVEFNHIKNATEYRIATLFFDGEKWQSIDGEDYTDYSTWKIIPANENVFSADSFTEIDENDTPNDYSDDVFRYIGFGVGEGIYMNKITAYENGNKIGETKLDVNNFDQNCHYYLDVTNPGFFDQKLKDESGNVVDAVVSGQTVEFKVDAVDSIAGVGKVWVEIYDFETGDQKIGQVDLSLEEGDIKNGKFTGSFEIPTTDIVYAKWKVFVEDLAGNLNQEGSFYNFVINGAGEHPFPSNLGWNLKSQSLDLDEMPLDLKCSSDQPVYTNQNYSSNVWQEINDSNYIRAIESPGGIMRVWGGSQKIDVSDFDDMLFISDNLTESYTNNSSAEWEFFEEGRGEYKTKIKSFIDQNGNQKYDKGETISSWSNECVVMFDEYPPSVDVGEDRLENDVYTQSAVVTDSHSGVESLVWSKESGPGELFFLTPNSDSTEVYASLAGSYVVRLTVTDKAGNSAYDEMTLNWSGGEIELIDLGYETKETGSLSGVGECNLITTDNSGNNGFAKQVAKIKDVSFANSINVQEYRWNGGFWEKYGSSILLVSRNLGYQHPDVVFDDISGIWSLELEAVGNNIFTFEALAFDGAGNKITETEVDIEANLENKEIACKYIVDKLIPYVDAGNDITTDSEFLQEAHVIDSHSGVEGYVWTKESGPGTVYFDSPQEEDTKIMADMNGEYVLRLTVTDKAGNSAYDEMILTWDTTPPIVTVDKVVTNDNTPRITGTVDKVSAQIKVTVDGVEYDAVNKGDGTWELANDVVHELVSEKYDVTVKGIGASGSIGIDNTLGELIVDLVQPEVDAGEDKYGNYVMQHNANASDSGSGIKSYTWTMESGPGNVSFGSPDKEDTTIAADAEGVYILRLTVIDYAGNSNYDEMVFYWSAVEGYTRTPLIEINDGDYKTDDRKVDLDLYPFNILTEQMMLSNNSNFDGASWEAFSPVKEWNLSGDRDDLKAVYVKFKDSNGDISEIAVNHIYLEENEEDYDDEEYEEEDYSSVINFRDTSSEDDDEEEDDSEVSFENEEENNESGDTYNYSEDVFSLVDEDNEEEVIDEGDVDNTEESVSEESDDEKEIIKPRSLIASIFWPETLIGKIFAIIFIIGAAGGIFVVTRKMAEREI